MGRHALRSRQKMKAMNKMVFMVAGASMLALGAYLTIFMNTTQVSTSRAGMLQNMMIGYEVNNGDVIASYTFDEGQPLKAERGPDATTLSKDAVCSKGGADNTKGLSPGKNNEGVNFEIPAIKELNLGGIDMSVDYRKSEENCDLFSRGIQFNLGIRESKIFIYYRVKNGRKTQVISEVTRYEIPDDDEFRNYRFLYDPVKGRSEIFVNGVAIWSRDVEPESILQWKESEKLIVGRNMKGDGTGKVVLDNVMIKATRQINQLPVTLLNFEAKAEKDYVMVTWFTASETEIDSFIIERSLDAKSFIEVDRIKAKGGVDKLTAYAIIDKTPNQGLAYYRLSPSNKPLKSMVISMIGYKYRGANGDLKLNDVQTPEATK